MLRQTQQQVRTMMLRYVYPGAMTAIANAGSFSSSATTHVAGYAYAAAAAGGGGAQAPAPPNALALIKELRERSGAPISDVKACLAEAGWRLDAAYDGLRKKGLAAAAKKAGRRAADGLAALAVAPDAACAAAVEVNSETDFVARAALFRRLAVEAAAAALPLAARGAGAAGAAGTPQEVSGDELAALMVPGTGGYEAAEEAGAPAGSEAATTRLADAAAEVAAKVRENVRARRALLLAAPAGGVVGGYTHAPAAPGLGRIVSAVALAPAGGGGGGGSAAGAGAFKNAEARAAAAQLASELAMHVAGLKPSYVDAAAIPAAARDAERKLLTEQAEASGKPAAAVEKMVAGRLAKWAAEACLLDQKFVLDDALTVRQLLAKRGAELCGAPLGVSGFLRMQVGDGIEPAEGAEGAKSFADEVASLAAGGGA